MFERLKSQFGDVCICMAYRTFFSCCRNSHTDKNVRDIVLKDRLARLEAIAEKYSISKGSYAFSDEHLLMRKLSARGMLKPKNTQGSSERHFARLKKRS